MTDLLYAGMVPVQRKEAAEHAHIGDRRDRAHAGRGHSRRGMQRPGQRAGHVPPEGGRSAPPRGGQPSFRCGGRGHAPCDGCRPHRFEGHRSRIVLHGPRPGALPARRRNRRKGVRMHAGHTDSGGEPLHRAHRDRPRPHRMPRSRAALCVRREHAGHRLRRGTLQDLRRNPGHRHREYAGQAREGARHGVLRRACVREAGQGRRPLL